MLEFKDYPLYDNRKTNQIDELAPARSRDDAGHWVPGPPRLVTYIRTITNAVIGHKVLVFT